MEQSSKLTPVIDFNDDTEEKQILHKTAAIQNLSQHNPDGDKSLSVPEQQHLHINFRRTNFAQNFWFGAYGEITSDVNSLQNCPGKGQSVFQSSSASKDMKMMTHSINIAEKRLWFIHIDRFYIRISQILEELAY